MLLKNDFLVNKYVYFILSLLYIDDEVSSTQ